jgi:hypothetical protein
MKTLWKIVGGILVCLVLVLLVLRVTGLNPHGDTPGRGSYPGLWLNGNLVTTPVADWSFTDKVQTVKVQTNTWYLIPHSVTIWCIAYNGQLYVATSGASVRQWPRNVARDPHVRLKIGDQLYDRTLVVVTDPAEREAVLHVRAKKYSQKYPPPAGVTFTVYHVMPV